MTVAQPSPQLVASVPGAVQQLRGEGTTVGWLQPSGCFAAKAVVGGRVVSFGRDSSDCQNDTPALWDVGAAGKPIAVSTSSGNETYADVRAGSFRRELVGDSALPGGEYVPAVAASGSARVYSVLEEASTDGCIDPTGGPCVQSVVPAKSYVQVVGGRRLAAYPAVRLDAREGVLVAAQAAVALQSGRAVPNGWIDVFTLPGLAKRASVHLPAGARVDDLAGSSAGFVVRSGTTLLRFDAHGRQLGRTPVARRARDLSMAGTRVVWRTGRIIRSVDVRTGRGGIVAIPHGQVTGVVVTAATRVVWAERDGRRTKLVALRLP